MKVLVTGGNGFVGSHIVDRLRRSGVGLRLLLRETSDTRFIERHLPHAELCYGSLYEPDSLLPAVEGVDRVVHCAGKVKAISPAEYYRANQDGTRYMVRSVNRCRQTVRRFVHISSRAVSGPSTSDGAALEDEEPAPVSDYGRSKLLAEREVLRGCKVPWTILRPSAVYGPRDTAFLQLFRAVRRRLMPLFDGGGQQINLVYVGDVAEAVLCAAGTPEAAGRIYNVASPHVSTARELLEEIARQMHVRPLPLHLPTSVLYPVCLLQEMVSHATGRPNILSRQKYRELREAGWVCSVERIRRELGFVARTSLQEGLGQTIQWYEKQGWL